MCEELATIPGSGRVQSLNVAAAAAIMIYLLTAPGHEEPRPMPGLDGVLRTGEPR